MPEVPYEPSTELNVAISLLFVADVAPGTVLPTQLDVVLQLALEDPLSSHVPLAARADWPANSAKDKARTTPLTRRVSEDADTI